MLLFLEFLHRIVQYLELIYGEACTVQAPNSDVKLHVPKGVHGAILLKIHTNHAKFMNHVHRNDCLVGPICEYHLQPFLNKSERQAGKFKIQIPHILKDIKKVRHQIRVSHGNLHSDSPLKVERKLMNYSRGGVYYDIDKYYVTIYTSHFTGYIVTAEGIQCCAQSANTHFFGSIRKIPGTEPLARLKVYFSSIHTDITDYKEVRHIQIYIQRGNFTFID